MRKFSLFLSFWLGGLSLPAVCAGTPQEAPMARLSAQEKNLEPQIQDNGSQKLLKPLVSKAEKNIANSQAKSAVGKGAEKSITDSHNHGEVVGQEEDPQWGKTPPIEGNTTVLHGLDKVTARVFALKVPHGKLVKFGTLQILVRGCRRSPPEEEPESAAFLEIFEEKSGEPRGTLFEGWMFGSSPSISSLEHPIYDIWVTDCRTEGRGEARR